MDEQEYENFLLEIADNVEALVEVPENRKRFEQHSCDLGKKHAAYKEAKERGAKQMPYEPLSGFLSVLTYTKDTPDEPPQLKIDEALAYYYFSLATIHDKMREEYIPIHNDDCAKQLANIGVWAIIENLCVDKPHIINTAFGHVEADLAGKQGNKRSIIGWIVEVIIALALLVICLYFFGVVTGIFIFAALLGIFSYLGWLGPIRTFINNILWPK